ncbi:hypothetical protein [Ferribacterium limneticum]|uniref:hypothetical protein n=1 Tax=Ferribacterium limneticum TaxID=76259 RepID=UPI001CFB79EF|nr:hypothetical protein [Ferribacterium limneticum]UCV19283.1 hypothetical protein KI610_01455 [Ferribacterium limneticum]UCV27185.1 hypothetical protein KI617_12940 [Ferribacterium limneticum]UCV31102.1 hypothetical protein KI608_12940 [Ferribacterium limneticum]
MQPNPALTLNAKVILTTFNGTAASPEECPRGENYWLLIGSTGHIAEAKNKNGRVLVLFDESVSGKGLHCHNPVPNSLYILESDLKAVS